METDVTPTEAHESLAALSHEGTGEASDRNCSTVAEKVSPSTEHAQNLKRRVHLFIFIVAYLMMSLT